MPINGKTTCQPRRLSGQKSKLVRAKEKKDLDIFFVFCFQNLSPPAHSKSMYESTFYQRKALLLKCHSVLSRFIRCSDWVKGEYSDDQCSKYTRMDGWFWLLWNWVMREGKPSLVSQPPKISLVVVCVSAPSTPPFGSRNSVESSGDGQCVTVLLRVPLQHDGMHRRM